MRLSHLLYALTLIAYSALQLGPKFYDIRLIWWGIIIATVVWILEGLSMKVTIPAIRRRQQANAEPAE